MLVILRTNPATYLVCVLLRLARIYAPAALLIRWISLLGIGGNEINGISQLTVLSNKSLWAFLNPRRAGTPRQLHCSDISKGLGCFYG